MASEFNKKATIREIMYLAQDQKDREMEATFEHYGTSTTRDVAELGIIFVDEVPPLVSDEVAETIIRFSDMDPQASCQHSRPMCDGCLARLGESAGDVTDL